MRRQACARCSINQIKIVLSTAANTVKGMEGQKKSAILHHP